MRRCTDLAGVKAVARMLLFQDIQPTAHAPVIVSHPFTSSGVVGLREANGNITFGDLMGSPDDLARWRQMVGEQIDEADSAISIFSLLNRSYYMAFIKYAALYLSEENLGQLLSNAWILNETPNQDPNIGKRELDDPVAVYRGVTSYNAGNVRALSWTLERKTAEWFAHRFGEKGTVYEAQIPKKHILAFFNNRGEAEVVLDPKHLEQVLESPKPEMGMRMT